MRQTFSAFAVVLLLFNLLPLTVSGQAVSTTAPPETRKIIFLGDVMLDRQPGALIARGGDPFAKVACILGNLNDALVVANLECVVATGGQRADKHFTFRADPRCLNVLTTHVDAVSLANNHSCDFGKQALVEMVGRLNAMGISSFGAGRDAAAAHAPLMIRSGTVDIALLAYNAIDSREAEAGPNTPGLAWLDEARAVADVRAARARAHVVIPFLHWGKQFQPRPTEEQRKIARALIDAGACAVVGSHPHVTQGTETYHGCPIIYSLGDFIFDFEDPAQAVPESMTNWILRLTVDKRGVLSWDTVVARTDQSGVPQPVTGAPSPSSRTAGDKPKR